jgi:hypothetical protein
MGLSVNGIEYRIKVTTGQSVSNANALNAALKRLQGTLDQVEKSMSRAGAADSQAARNLKTQTESIAATQKQATAIRAQVDATKQASRETDRWSAGISKLNAKWADGKSWRAGISHVNEARQYLNSAASGTDRWAAGVRILSAEWSEGSRWRRGIGVINEASKAQQAASLTADRWAMGIEKLNQKWRDAAPWRRGIASLPSEMQRMNADSPASRRDRQESQLRADLDAARTRLAPNLRRLRERLADDDAREAAADATARTQASRNANLGLFGAAYQARLRNAGVGPAGQIGQGATPAQQQAMQLRQQQAMQAYFYNQQRANRAAAAASQGPQGPEYGGHGVIAGLIGLFATTRILGAIRNVTLLAGRVDNLETVMLHVGHTASISAGQMFVLEKGMKGLGITTQVSREILTRFAQNNLKVSESLKFSRIAQDAAVIAGENSSVTAERMMIAVQRLDTRMLRNLGILINLRSEYQRFALTTGRAENTLSAAEKQQIVLNAVMRAGVAISGTYETALEDVFKQYTSLDRKVEEASRTIGDHFLPVFSTLVTISDKVLSAVASQRDGWSAFIAVLLGQAGGFAIGLVVLGIAFAFTTLVAALSPVAIVVLAVAQALGGLVTIISLYEQASRRAREESIRLTQEGAYERFRLRELADEIERLSSIKKRTADQDIQLAHDRIEVTSLLHGEEGAVLAATNSWSEYVAKVRDLKRLGGPISESDAETIARLKNELGKGEAKLDEWIEKVRKFRYQGVMPEDREQELRKKFKEFYENDYHFAELQRKIDAIESENRSQRLRHLNDLATASETVDQIAQRTRQSLEKAALNKLLPEKSGDLLEQLEATKNLISATLTLAEIKERASAKIADADLSLRQQQDAINASTDKREEKTKKLREQEDKYRVTVASIRAEEQSEIESLEKRSKLTTDLIKGIKRGLADFAQERREAAYLSEMEAKGVGHVAKAIVELDSIYRASADSTEYYTTKIGELQKELDKLTKEVAGGGDVQHGAERIAAMKELIDLLGQFRDSVPGDALNKAMKAFRQFAQEAKIDAASMRDLRRETEAMRRESALLAAGISGDMVNAIGHATEANIKYEDEINSLLEMHTQLGNKADEVKKKLANPNLDKQETTKLGGQLQVLQSAMKSIEDAIRAHDLHRIEQTEKTEAEIAEIKKKAQEEVNKAIDTEFKRSVDNIRKRIDDTKKQIDDIVKDRKDALNKTDEEIFKQRLSMGAFGANSPAISAFYELYREFSPLVKGAGDKRQINELGTLFQQRVATQFGQVNPRGREGQILAAFAGRLNQESQERVKELDNQQKQLEQQIIIANNSTSQVLLLKAMLANGADRVSILKALAAHEAAGNAAIQVDDAQRVLQKAQEKAREGADLNGALGRFRSVQGSAAAARQRLSDLRRSRASQEEIDAAKADVRTAEQNESDARSAVLTARRFHRTGGPRFFMGRSIEEMDAQKALDAARKNRDDLAKQVPNLNLQGGRLGRENVDPNSPLGKILKDQIGGFMDFFSGKGFTNRGIGSAFQSLLDGIKGAKESIDHYLDAEEKKTDETIKHLEEQQKATDLAAKEATKAVKDIQDITAKVRQTISGLGLRF